LARVNPLTALRMTSSRVSEPWPVCGMAPNWSLVRNCTALSGVSVVCVPGTDTGPVIRSSAAKAAGSA